MKTLFRLCLLGSAIVLAAMLGWSYPIILDGTGIARVPETQLLGYSTDEARSFFTALTEAGRAQYLGPQAMLDWAFPAILALILILAVFRWAKLVPFPRKMLPVLLAVAAVAVDYYENALITAALNTPADQLTDAALEHMALMTQCKTYLFAAAILVTGGVVTGGLIRRRRRRK